MYSALDIANYVLGYYYEKNRLCISNLKLQKILYFLQAEFLVSKKKPLFKDEIEAYGFGPVVYEVNKRYWIYGGTSIPYNLIDQNKTYKQKILNSDKKNINNMLDVLEDYSSPALLEIIHNQDPWKNSYHGNGKRKFITNEQLYNFFSEPLIN